MWTSENAVKAKFAEYPSLLKKSLWDRSVVQNKSKTPENQGKTLQDYGFELSNGGQD
jgi:hypothetical protein